MTNKTYTFKQVYILIIITSVLLSCNNTSTERIEDKAIAKESLKKVELVEQDVYKKDFLWREKVLSKETGDSISQIIINKAYSKNIGADEKAAILYVLSFVENGCKWEDGTISMSDDKLLCKGLSSLGFDYQHSPKHISFLKSWFANDTVALKEIDNCPRFFTGTTIRTTIKSIVLKKTGNEITVFATKISHNSRVGKSTEWMDIYVFISERNSLLLVKPKTD